MKKTRVKRRVNAVPVQRRGGRRRRGTKKLIKDILERNEICWMNWCRRNSLLRYNELICVWVCLRCWCVVRARRSPLAVAICLCAESLASHLKALFFLYSFFRVLYFCMQNNLRRARVHVCVVCVVMQQAAHILIYLEVRVNARRELKNKMWVCVLINICGASKCYVCVCVVWYYSVAV